MTWLTVSFPGFEFFRLADQGFNDPRSVFPEVIGYFAADLDRLWNRPAFGARLSPGPFSFAAVAHAISFNRRFAGIHKNFTFLSTSICNASFGARSKSSSAFCAALIGIVSRAANVSAIKSSCCAIVIVLLSLVGCVVVMP